MAARQGLFGSPAALRHALAESHALCVGGVRTWCPGRRPCRRGAGVGHGAEIDIGDDKGARAIAGVEGHDGGPPSRGLHCHPGARRDVDAAARNSQGLVAWLLACRANAAAAVR